MATSSRNEDQETFPQFFNRWMVEQNQHLDELVSALRETELHLTSRSATIEELESIVLRPKVARVLDHYRHYYHLKKRWATNHVLSFFKPSWTSELEDSDMWITGWRPFTVFQVLISKFFLQLHAHLGGFLIVPAPGDLSCLKQTQINQLNELQELTVRQEWAIDGEYAMISMTNEPLVRLSHAVSESMREGVVVEDQYKRHQVEVALGKREVKLREVMERADGLRESTLEQVVGVLTPKEGVHLLVAVAELQQRVHQWGKEMDAH